MGEGKMSNNLYLKYKSNYGSEKVYPNCKTSLAITRLLGTKTVTPMHLKVLKDEMNYNILFLGVDYIEKDLEEKGLKI